MTFANALTLVSILLPVLYFVGQMAYQLFLERLPSAKRAVVSEVVDNAVTAVEQMVTAPGSGPLKKQNATALIATMLKARHINVPEEEISALIECAVATMNAAKDAKPAPIGFSPASAPASAPAATPAAPATETPQPAPAPAGIVGLVGPRF